MKLQYLGLSAVLTSVNSCRALALRGNQRVEQAKTRCVSHNQIKGSSQISGTQGVI